MCIADFKIIHTRRLSGFAKGSENKNVLGILSAL